MDEHDHCENEFSLIHGFRLLSAYTLSSGTKIWIITEADRSVTMRLDTQRRLHLTDFSFGPHLRTQGLASQYSSGSSDNLLGCHLLRIGCNVVPHLR